MTDDEFGRQAILLVVTSALIVIPLLIAKRSSSGMFKVRVATISMSIAAFLSVVWITVIEKAGAAKSVEAFGQQPLGIPLSVFLPLMSLILGAPVPCFIRYTVIEVFLQYGLLDPDELPDGWERGHSIAKWIVGYLVLLALIWIVSNIS